jgi:hypothetical protein
MSKISPSLAAGSLALALLAAAPARAELVAGWDFSQYLGDGTLVIDDGSLFQFVDTLSANYSNLDPTFNAGAESALFGTMYIDGQFGSTAVPAGTAGAEQILPGFHAPTGSLASNLDAPVQAIGDHSFDSLQILQFEGQVNANALAMAALADANVVFEADRGTPGIGNWILSLGARTQTGTASLAVEASPTGAGYTSAGSAQLTTTDTRYEFDLGPVAGAKTFVRLRFGVTAPDYALFDNVAISVPEPGAAAGAMGAALALAFCARRRGRA